MGRMGANKLGGLQATHALAASSLPVAAAAAAATDRALCALPTPTTAGALVARSPANAYLLARSYVCSFVNAARKLQRARASVRARRRHASDGSGRQVCLDPALTSESELLFYNCPHHFSPPPPPYSPSKRILNRANLAPLTGRHCSLASSSPEPQIWEMVSNWAANFDINALQKQIASG